jgi:hypothetical protein
MNWENLAFIKMDHMDGRWMKMALDRVQMRTCLRTVLNFQTLLFLTVFCELCWSVAYSVEYHGMRNSELWETWKKAVLAYFKFIATKFS